MMTNGMRPVHPGEALREDYLLPLRLTAGDLARHLQAPPTVINDIILERCGVTADIALRLSRCFGGDAQSWLDLQNQYDLRKAELDPALQTALQSLEPLKSESSST